MAGNPNAIEIHVDGSFPDQHQVGKDPSKTTSPALDFKDFSDRLSKSLEDLLDGFTKANANLAKQATTTAQQATNAATQQAPTGPQANTISQAAQVAASAAQTASQAAQAVAAANTAAADAATAAAQAAQAANQAAKNAQKQPQQPQQPQPPKVTPQQQATQNAVRNWVQGQANALAGRAASFIGGPLGSAVGHATAAGISSGGSLAGAASVAARSLVGMASSAGLMGGALAGVKQFYDWYQSAKANLLAEGQRVKMFSPEIRQQEIINKIRELQTNQEIAQKYGGQIAKIQDRESRQEQSWRKFNARLSSAYENMFGGVAESYTRFIEFMAGDRDWKTTFLGTLAMVSEEDKKKAEQDHIKRENAERLKFAQGQCQKALTALGSSYGGAIDPSSPMNVGKEGEAEDGGFIADWGRNPLPKEAPGWIQSPRHIIDKIMGRDGFLG